MGRPVRILDLARNVVELSGLEPEQDIRITLTGLRQGERLNEVLITDGQDVVATEHEKVLMIRNPDFDRDEFRRNLEALRELVAGRDQKNAVAQLKVMASDSEESSAP
jgi:FlaA1/EpsC-like NDP-sugar epimerase